MRLTHRDLEIVETLNTRVRLLTLIQITAAWWPGAKAGLKIAADRLELIAQAGLIRIDRVLARPLLALSMPEFSWRPGQRPPAFGSVSWRLNSRWAGHPKMTKVLFSSPRGLGVFGGATSGRIKNLCQVTHDLHMGTVFLIYRSRWPEACRDWVGEDVLAPSRKRQKLPDAMLINSRGEPYRVIEFGGSYSARRVAAFHADCAWRGLPYELW